MSRRMYGICEVFLILEINLIAKTDGRKEGTQSSGSIHGVRGGGFNKGRKEANCIDPLILANPPYPDKHFASPHGLLLDPALRAAVRTHAPALLEGKALTCSVANTGKKTSPAPSPAGT